MKTRNVSMPFLKKLAGLALLLILAGCATYRSRFDENAAYFERAETQENDRIKVTVVGLSASESKKTFGVNLTGRHILPVWIKIENKDPNHAYFFLERSVDPDYYTAGEAAFISQFHVGYRLGKFLPPLFVAPLKWIAFPFENLFAGKANRKMRDDFEAHAFKYGWIQSGETRSGFVFLPFELGTKEIPIDLYSDEIVQGKAAQESFLFYIPIPGLRTDHSGKNGKLYGPEETRKIEDKKELLQALSELPCCISDKKGEPVGDPMNLVVIGDKEELLNAFVAAKWDETELIYLGSMWKMAKSFSFKKNYRYSPISPQYYEGRSQDIAFQKARSTINERMHLRLWESPMRYHGKPVWVGAVSRDIGVRFTTRTWNLMTHEIDPDVDESALYTLSDMVYWHRLEEFAIVRGCPPSTKENPAHNILGSPYYTSGKRVVLVLTKTRHLEFPSRLDAEV